MLGGLLVAGGLGFRGRLAAIPRRDWPGIVGLALLGLVATQLLQAYALERSTSASTAWLVALNPVVTALLAAWLLGERLAGKVAGLVLGFGGALLVVGQGRSPAATLALSSARGDALTLLSTASWALYTVYGRGFVTRHDPPLVTAYLLGTAALVFAPPFVVGRGWQELATLSAGGWLCLLYLGLGCSGLAFLLYYAALAHLEAGQVAAFIYIEPLIAQALALAFLDEPFTPAVVVGGAAILGGVYLVMRPETKSRAAL